MNTLEAAKTKTDRVARTLRAITADSKGELPSSIELLQVGIWRTPYHGDFMITPDDLQEYVDNFEAGIGLVAAGIGAPIDFSHDSHKEAAGWIKKIYVKGDTLVGDVEWSTAGKEALLGGLFKCFSPEFYPNGRGGWCDPEDYDTFITNVLVGGGLTNIPLFKDLTPVMASASSNDNNEVKEDKNVIYIKASSEKEAIMPTLEEVRAKEVSVLTEEEKTFLAEHKAELTADEQAKFGFEVAETAEAKAVREEAEAKAKADADAAAAANVNVDADAAAVAASVKSGESVVIKASEFAAMKASTEAYRKEKAEQVVKAHIARGAIKADQLSAWTDRILADATTEELLKGLADNPVLASEQGSDAGSGNVVSAAAEIRTKAADLVKAAKEADQKLDIATAMSKVMASEPELAERYNKEVNEQA